MPGALMPSSLVTKMSGRFLAMGYIKN